MQLAQASPQTTCWSDILLFYAKQIEDSLQVLSILHGPVVEMTYFLCHYLKPKWPCSLGHLCVFRQLDSEAH